MMTFAVTNLKHGKAVTNCDTYKSVLCVLDNQDEASYSQIRWHEPWLFNNANYRDRKYWYKSRHSSH